MMSDSTSSDFSEEETCIDWLLSQEGNHLLCRVEEDYIEDNFNLYGLNKIIPNFRDSIRLLLSDSASVEGCLEEGWVGPSYEHLLDLYGLIHARYILTSQGLSKMRRKLHNNVFGSCPEPEFAESSVLPVGLSDHLRQGPPVGYCLASGEIYKMGVSYTNARRHCLIYVHWTGMGRLPRWSVFRNEFPAPTPHAEPSDSWATRMASTKFNLQAENIRFQGEARRRSCRSKI